jgi:hypothetical protein
LERTTVRRLTIAATNHMTNVYMVEVPDDFDINDTDALLNFFLEGGDEVLLLSQTGSTDVVVESDERV